MCRQTTLAQPESPAHVRGSSKAVLAEVLGEQFDGIGVTDDYSAYQSQLTDHQLCWAHFLRKAIALSLRNPENGQYKRFLKSSRPTIVVNIRPDQKRWLARRLERARPRLAPSGEASS
jgi:hypothetical protein